MEKEKKSVLFVCSHNSARSQMAEALLRSLHGGRYEVSSAGTEPTSVSPHAVQVMAEIGIDISGQRAKSVDEFLDRRFDYVITVCDRARESCPFFPGGAVIHQGFKDPAGAEGEEEEILTVFREVRDEIKEWMERTFQHGGELRKPAPGKD